LRYIERDGVNEDGTKGLLYGADGPLRAEAFDEPRRGEKHQFRIIVSPEDARELDLTAYVRRLMAQVERDTGRRLEWAAVNHYDTDHPHAHLIVRGVDRDGRELRLDRGYISNGLRSRAQELATEELGPRLDVDVRRSLDREVTQARFTSLDRELERRAQDGRVEGRSRRHAGRIDESLLVARLEHLEALRLADRVAPASWTLQQGWQEQLRELAARGDILKQIHMAVGGDRSRYRIVRDRAALQTDGIGGSRVVSGRVASKGLSDELKGTFYAVVETPTGHAYHVALDRRTVDTVQRGDILSFTTKPETPVRPVDRHIAEVARAQGGFYTLVRTAGAEPAAPEWRLRELERTGLVTPEAPDRWKVSPNLLEKLAERQREAPVRQRVLLRKEPLSLQGQIRHPGPVWLDRVPTDSLAPYGFGAELKRTLEQRRDALHALGIAPDDTRRDIKLREIERVAVGEGMAVRTRQHFLAKTPDGFRGRLQAGPEGAPYSVVSDGARFVLVPASSEHRALTGKALVISRDAQGRLTIRAPDRDWER
jgi:type IV secretory pathway VirD2 relaxase